ncbi:MAG: hypothetical protein EOP48_13135 [Sphingobacteriales bacterium]|nr:MAG: hypothetical protein EOP48_13135 [Sphingobacteriales bacterium]
MKQWFAVYTMTGHEKKVAIYLKKKEIEYFLPLKAFTSSWTDLNKNRNPVLFPSTIFVYITLDQFENVKQISGVLNFFHWFDEPASFNDNEIEMINLFLLEHKVVEIEKTAVKPFLKPASGKKEVRVKNMFGREGRHSANKCSL